MHAWRITLGDLLVPIELTHAIWLENKILKTKQKKNLQLIFVIQLTRVDVGNVNKKG